MKRKEWSKLAFTSIMGLLLSYTFVFLAALPLRYLRLTYGRTAFLISSILGVVAIAAFGLWQWAGVYMALCLLIGSYRELEERQLTIFRAATFSILSTAGLSVFGTWAFTTLKGVSLHKMLTSSAAPLIEQMKDVPNFEGISTQQFLWHVPSAIVITLMLALFVSLTVSRAPRSQSEFLKMRMFSLPDWVIWVFIASLGIAFVPTVGESLYPQNSEAIHMISMNILFVTLAAYFFQGLAVLTHFLDRLGLFGFWRLLAYFLAFFQLFIFVSGLGILDYWFDFRLQPSRNYRKKSFN